MNQPIYEIPVNGGEPPRVEPPSFPPPGHPANSFAPPSLSDYGPPSVPADVHVIDVDVATAPVTAPMPPQAAPAAFRAPAARAPSSQRRLSLSANATFL